ncbi:MULTISPECIES: extracellular solute-binding protein [unclassified Paenibacillus]|uniref:extracellular solute-binding protein n=1 Tax=unclassified Paenibacillus TaxID=185978 RepID=UPI00363FE436
MYTRNKTAIVLLSSMILTSSIIGCSSSSDTKSGSGEGAAKAEKTPDTTPLKLSLLLQITGEPPQKDNEAQKAIEKYTNSTLDIQWTADMKAKLPVLVASGDLPKAVSFGNSQLRLPYMVSAMRSNVFWDLTPYLKDYKNLTEGNDLRYKNTSLDGKSYGIPVVRPLSRNAMVYRKDWLTNLGLKEPKTTEELYQVLKAFTFNDPDKNGKNDTYGILEFKSVSLINNIAAWFGVPNTWAVKDGKFTAAHETEEYLVLLKFLRRLYEEKIMNQDFAVMEKAGWEAAFSSGKAGMIGNITNTAFKLTEKVVKTDPKAELDMFSRLPGAVDKTMAENGTNGIIVFPKSSVKTEAELKQILSFFDKLGDEQMATLFKWGIEGKHFKLNNGKAAYTDEKSYKSEVLPLRALMSADDSKAKPGNEPMLLQKEAQMNAENEKYALGNIAEALVAPTQTEKGGELDKIVMDGVIKFMMGKIDEDGWKKTVETWRKSGGDKMKQEYEEEYKKSVK